MGNICPTTAKDAQQLELQIQLQLQLQLELQLARYAPK